MKRTLWLGAALLIALAAAIPVWLVLDDGGGGDDRTTAAFQELEIKCEEGSNPDLCAEAVRVLHELDGHLVVAEDRLLSAQDVLQRLEERLNSVGDDAQLANVDLQNILQKQQQTLQMLSNISKALHDSAMAIIRKLGG